MNFNALFYPKSIAVVGASRTPKPSAMMWSKIY